jgi:hypothetical protein
MSIAERICSARVSALGHQARQQRTGADVRCTGLASLAGRDPAHGSGSPRDVRQAAGEQIGVDGVQHGLADRGHPAYRLLQRALADGGDRHAGAADGGGEVVGQVHVGFPACSASP